MRRWLSALAVAVVLVSACEPLAPEDGRQEPAPAFSSSPGRTDAELTFARLALGVIVEQHASLDVMVGDPGRLELRYLNLDPTAPPLLEFEVGANSLVSLNGVPLPPRTPVAITVTLERLDPLDPLDRRYIFRFTPSGLTFSPHDPARLRVNYEGTDPDVNGDTYIDERDTALKHQFRIWQQDLPDPLWRQLPTKRLPGDVIEGRVTHFTGFAMAS